MNPITLFKRPRSRFWWMTWRDSSGRRPQVSTHLPIAEYPREIAERLVNSADGRLPESAHTISWFHDFTLARLESENAPEKTVRQYRIAFRVLSELYDGSTDIHSLKRDVVSKFKMRCIEHGMAADSVNTYCAYIRAAFEDLVKSDLLELNPFHHFKKVQKRVSKKRHLTKKESLHFLDILNSWENETARRLLRIILYQGLRLSEVLKIEPADVDLEYRALNALNVKSKDKHKRWMPIHPKAFDDLKFFLDHFDKSYQGVPGRPFDRCHPDTLTHWAKKLMVAAGFPSLNTYSLRHTFATLAIQHGMSPRELQKHMDHSSFSVTENYTHDIPRLDRPPELGI